MSTEDLTIETADGGMPTYQSAPDGTARGAVVVIQEAFGVTDHIRSVADRFAAAGWLAVAPAFFHRQGSPVVAYDDVASVMPIMGELSAAGLRMDLEAAFDHLDAAGFPAARTATVGFCMGGSVSFFAATLRPLGASVTYYGGGVSEGRFGLPSLLELAPTLQTPWLGQFGDLDKGIPVADVEQLRTAVEAAPVDTDIVRYADADHGFNCNDRPSVYNPGAAAAAWDRTLAWFDQHVAKG